MVRKEKLRPRTGVLSVLPVRVTRPTEATPSPARPETLSSRERRSPGKLAMDDSTVMGRCGVGTRLSPGAPMLQPMKAIFGVPDAADPEATQVRPHGYRASQWIKWPSFAICLIVGLPS